MPGSNVSSRATSPDLLRLRECPQHLAGAGGGGGEFCRMPGAGCPGVAPDGRALAGTLSADRCRSARPAPPESGGAAPRHGPRRHAGGADRALDRGRRAGRAGAGDAVAIAPARPASGDTSRRAGAAGRRGRDQPRGRRRAVEQDRRDLLREPLHQPARHRSGAGCLSPADRGGHPGADDLRRRA